MTMQMMMPMTMACIEATAAPSLSFSPILRATIAVVAMDKPIASPATWAMTTSVKPTVAVASFPNLATKKMSTMANSPSISISRTIGIDNRIIARSILPEVYSVSSPEMACRKSLKKCVVRRFMGPQK